MWTHAAVGPRASSQDCTRVVFPLPGGADTRVTVPSAPWSRRSKSRERMTSPDARESRAVAVGSEGALCAVAMVAPLVRNQHASGAADGPASPGGRAGRLPGPASSHQDRLGGLLDLCLDDLDLV